MPRKDTSIFKVIISVWLIYRVPTHFRLTAEELYVRKHIIDETPDVIINVVDAGNLERNLYLTAQLIDMNVRMVVALNMYDALLHSGNTLDHKKLGQLFGVPIVPTVSRTGKGIDNLFHVIIGLYEALILLARRKKYKMRLCASIVNGMISMFPIINMAVMMRKLMI